MNKSIFCFLIFLAPFLSHAQDRQVQRDTIRVSAHIDIVLSKLKDSIKFDSYIANGGVTFRAADDSSSAIEKLRQLQMDSIGRKYIAIFQGNDDEYPKIHIKVDEKIDKPIDLKFIIVGGSPRNWMDQSDYIVTLVPEDVGSDALDAERSDKNNQCARSKEGSNYGLSFSFEKILDKNLVKVILVLFLFLLTSWCFLQTVHIKRLTQRLKKNSVDLNDSISKIQGLRQNILSKVEEDISRNITSSLMQDISRQIDEKVNQAFSKLNTEQGEQSISQNGIMGIQEKPKNDFSSSNVAYDQDISRQIDEKVNPAISKLCTEQCEQSAGQNEIMGIQEKPKNNFRSSNVAYDTVTNTFSISSEVSIHIFEIFEKDGDYFLTLVDDAAIREEFISVLGNYEKCIKVIQESPFPVKADVLENSFGHLIKEGNVFRVDPAQLLNIVLK